MKKNESELFRHNWLVFGKLPVQYYARAYFQCCWFHFLNGPLKNGFSLYEWVNDSWDWQATNERNLEKKRFAREPEFQLPIRIHTDLVNLIKNNKAKYMAGPDQYHRNFYFLPQSHWVQILVADWFVRCKSNWSFLWLYFFYEWAHFSTRPQCVKNILMPAISTTFDSSYPEETKNENL